MILDYVEMKHILDVTYCVLFDEILRVEIELYPADEEIWKFNQQETKDDSLQWNVGIKKQSPVEE